MPGLLMKILITGHQGFIGSNLFNYFKYLGYQVDGWEYIENKLPNVKNYDWVIHEGAISSTTYSNIKQIMKQNFQFSLNLLNSCNKHKVNFQYASSASMYKNSFKENDPLFPISPYSWSKYFFDYYIEQYKHLYDINIQGFRYFNVYGKGEDHKGNQASPVTKFTNQAKLGNIKLFENSNSYKRDFICVNDICLVHLKMLKVNCKDIFNIGTGKSNSFEKIAQLISNKYSSNIQYIKMPKEIKDHYQVYTCADLTKLNSIINIKWTNIKDYINENC
jgi:ADP-L-glycero-D-manno-heptose 6-epimerase